MMFPKNKPDRDAAYLKFVRSLPCVVSGALDSQAHHLIGHGHGGMGTKVSDYWTFPLSPIEHQLLHDHGWKAWEELNGSQWKYVAETQRLWIAQRRAA